MNSNESNTQNASATVSDLEATLRDEGQSSEARESALIELVTRSTKQKRIDNVFELIELGKKIAGNNKLGLARILKRLLDAHMDVPYTGLR